MATCWRHLHCRYRRFSVLYLWVSHFNLLCIGGTVLLTYSPHSWFVGGQTSIVAVVRIWIFSFGILLVHFFPFPADQANLFTAASWAVSTTCSRTASVSTTSCTESRPSRTNAAGASRISWCLCSVRRLLTRRANRRSTRDCGLDQAVLYSNSLIDNKLIKE